MKNEDRGIEKNGRVGKRNKEVEKVKKRRWRAMEIKKNRDGQIKIIG